MIWRTLKECRQQALVPKVKFTWSKVQYLRLTVILPIIISCLFMFLSKMSMNKEISFLFLRGSQKALQLPVSLFFFFFYSLVFLNRPTSVFCTFDWLLYAGMAVSSNILEKKYVVNVRLIWNFLCENITCHVL